MRRMAFGWVLTVTVWVFAAVAAAAQQVQIEGAGRYSSLAQALSVAPAGAVLRISGTHRGTHVIDRPVALVGEAGATLDGGGGGTVLRIVADDVRIETLTITGSGLSTDYREARGAAGIHVTGSRAVLAGLMVQGNAWGVIMQGGQGTVLRDSQVEDNQRDGVLILGGADHVISGSTIARNRVGVFIDSDTGENQRVLMPQIGDTAWNQQLATIQGAATPALRHVVEGNTIRGNAAAGIRIQFHARELRIIGNTVFATGIERAPDADERAFWAAYMGVASLTLPVETVGAGIVIFCLPEHNRVEDNDVHDNLAMGLYLSFAPFNTIAANRFHDNATGIEVASSQDGVIVANVVSGNRDYGIRVGGWLWMGQGRPDRNLIVLNDLDGNGVNAFDASDQLLTADEIADQFALIPWPEEMRQVYDNPMVRAQAAAMMVAHQVLGHNRWDDGTHGNRHSGFDESAEGFVDRDGNGIGEVAHPIPGGGAVDHRPLTAAALASALAAGAGVSEPASSPAADPLPRPHGKAGR